MRTRNYLIVGLVLLLAVPSIGVAQGELADRLYRAIRAAGVSIVGVSIGDPANKGTWRVQPSSLQGAAQPTIDAFDPNDPAHLAAELDAEVLTALDAQRLISAVVWAVIDTYSNPATRAKYLAARTKIVNAFKAEPWKA